MEPDDLTVDPGSEVTTKVTVRNLGTRVEEFELVAQGPGAAFASIIPATLSIYPDVEQRAVVRFAPLRGPQSVAGVTTFEVVARSVLHADVHDVARGRLTVTPFDDLKAVLVPDTSRGRKPARHQVSVTNGGNTPLTTQLVFKDQDSVLTFQPPEATAALGPGVTEDVPVLINGPRRWFGRTERLAFSAVVSPTSAQPPITLNGIRQQTPVFPWWAPPAAVAVVALAIALAALLIRTPTVPVIPQVDEVAAVKLLEEAKYQPEPVKAGDDTVAEGLAIKTDPAAGAPLKRGERVKLFISTGKCPDGPCPVEVPNVVGKPVAEATALLEGMKFTVRTDRVTSDERPADHVIASDPAATTPRPVGSDVTLTVSTGPQQDNNASANPGGAVPLPVPLPGDKPAGDKPPGDKPAEDKPPGDKPAEDKPADDKPADDKPPPPGDKPPAPLELPDLTAQSVGDATKALAGLGLKAKTVPQHTNAVPDGQVLSTTPAAKSKVEPGSDVTLTVAQNTDRVDLLATAAKATWTNKSGQSLKFPGKEEDQIGFVRQRPATVAGTPALLETNPQNTGAITGEYTLPQPAVPGDHIRARVGLLPTTTGGATGATAGAVTFQVKANGKVIHQVKATDNKLQELNADLSSAKGAKTIEITVLADPTSTQNTAPVWQDLQLTPPNK